MPGEENTHLCGRYRSRQAAVPGRAEYGTRRQAGGGAREARRARRRRRRAGRAVEARHARSDDCDNRADSSVPLARNHANSLNLTDKNVAKRVDCRHRVRGEKKLCISATACAS